MEAVKQWLSFICLNQCYSIKTSCVELWQCTFFSQQLHTEKKCNDFWIFKWIDLIWFAHIRIKKIYQFQNSLLMLKMTKCRMNTFKSDTFTCNYNFLKNFWNFVDQKFRESKLFRFVHSKDSFNFFRFFPAKRWVLYSWSFVSVFLDSIPRCII